MLSIINTFKKLSDDIIDEYGVPIPLAFNIATSIMVF